MVDQALAAELETLAAELLAVRNGAPDQSRQALPRRRVTRARNATAGRPWGRLATCTSAVARSRRGRRPRRLSQLRAFEGGGRRGDRCHGAPHVFGRVNSTFGW